MMSKVVTEEQKTFTVFGRKIYTHIYSPSNTQVEFTVFAIHGWMDNLASFTQLIAELIGKAALPIKVVAIDLAGHGKSDHFTGLGAYNIWSDIGDITAIADQLELKHFSLLGHSRGAMVSMILAGTYPDRIDNVILIESILPAYSRDEDAPKHLADSITAQLKLMNRKRNYYRSFDDAVKARMKGFVPLEYIDAKILAEHGVVENEKGFYWEMAPLLMSPSEVKLTFKQLNAFFEAITAKILLFIATDGFIVKNTELTSWIKKQTHITTHTLNGQHHFHMSQCASHIASLIAPLLSK